MVSAIDLACATDVTPPTPILRPRRHQSPGTQARSAFFLSFIENPLDGFIAKNDLSKLSMSSSLQRIVPAPSKSPSFVRIRLCDFTL